MTTNFKPKFLSPNDTAKLLRVSRSLIYKLVKENAIPHSFVGKRIAIPVSYLEEQYGVIL